jgi:hypothetical protein
MLGQKAKMQKIKELKKCAKIVHKNKIIIKLKKYGITKNADFDTDFKPIRYFSYCWALNF